MSIKRVAGNSEIPKSRSISPINIMNETTGDSLALEKDSLPYERTENFESSGSGSDSQIDPQSPLLPRSGWQNRRAFLSVLIRVKQSLDIAEITATLWD